MYLCKIKFAQRKYKVKKTIKSTGFLKNHFKKSSIRKRWVGIFLQYSFKGCHTSRLPYLIGPTNCSSSLLLLSNRGFLQYFGLHFLLSFQVVCGGAVNTVESIHFSVFKSKIFFLIKTLDKKILWVQQVEVYKFHYLFKIYCA